ncbi:hypothetical protein, partial [Pseudomonas fluorescens]|uniref:hypothetical protein n=1 Tax=Pseudomonas fluorescens TaxID=294 RepID=UPI001CD2B1B3
RGLIAWDFHVSPDLNLSNRPVRTRMPGGVAGARSMTTVPYADLPAISIWQYKTLWERACSRRRPDSQHRCGML